jgi:hypothetical protein
MLEINKYKIYKFKVKAKTGKTIPVTGRGGP